jgi:hypothetical protein
MSITKKVLRDKVDLINRLTNSPVEGVGSYQLSSAYGGYDLLQIVSESGAIESAFNKGYVTGRQLEYLLTGFITGLSVNNQGEE